MAAVQAPEQVPLQQELEREEVQPAPDAPGEPQERAAQTPWLQQWDWQRPRALRQPWKKYRDEPQSPVGGFAAARSQNVQCSV